MSIYGIPTREERDDLSAQLAFLYLQKTDISELTPTEFAEKYFKIKDEIQENVVSSRTRL